MNLSIRFTPAARAQLLAAVTYIRADSPTAAAAFLEKTTHSLSRLTKFPDSGRVIPEFPDLPFREVIVVRYRFFYRIQDRIIWIVGAWHDAQLPEPPEP